MVLRIENERTRITVLLTMMTMQHRIGCNRNWGRLERNPDIEMGRMTQSILK